MCLFLCQCHAVLTTMALEYSLILGSMIPPTLFFFLKIVVAIWGLLCLHINFWNICFSFVKLTISFKIPMVYFRPRTNISKIYMEPQKAPHSKGILRKNKAGGIVLHIIKLYYKAIVIKTAWYWHNDRHINQWNKIESPEKKPHLYSQLTFNRGRKHLQWAKDSLFNKWCWGNWTDTCRKIKLDHLLTPHTRINSKWIKDLNVRPKTIKVLRKT